MNRSTLSELGCAGMIAAVAFVVGGVASFFDADATLVERGLMAIGTAAMAFVAAWLLARDDSARHKEAVRSVGRMLKERRSMDDAEYASQFPVAERALVLQVRSAVAEFFGAEAEKILPIDDLRRDYQYDVLVPGFDIFVVQHVCAARKIEPRRYFLFRSGDVTNVADLSMEVPRILDGFSSAEKDEGVNDSSPPVS